MGEGVDKDRGRDAHRLNHIHTSKYILVRKSVCNAAAGTGFEHGNIDTSIWQPT